MNALESLYNQIILDHSRAPVGRAPWPAAPRRARQANPLCGDQITVALDLDEQGRVVVRFEAQGCALCIASASIMVERCQGSTAQQADALAQALLASLDPAHSLPDASLPDASLPDASLPDASLPDASRPDASRATLEALLVVRQTPSRRRCVALPWQALRQALAQP